MTLKALLWRDLSETKQHISFGHSGDVSFFAQRTLLAAREALCLAPWMRQKVCPATIQLSYLKCFHFWRRQRHDGIAAHLIKAHRATSLRML